MALLKMMGNEEELPVMMRAFIWQADWNMEL